MLLSFYLTNCLQPRVLCLYHLTYFPKIEVPAMPCWRGFLLKLKMAVTGLRVFRLELKLMETFGRPHSLHLQPLSCRACRLIAPPDSIMPSAWACSPSPCGMLRGLGVAVANVARPMTRVVATRYPQLQPMGDGWRCCGDLAGRQPSSVCDHARDARGSPTSQTISTDPTTLLDERLSL